MKNKLELFKWSYKIENDPLYEPDIKMKLCDYVYFPFNTHFFHVTFAESKLKYFFNKL